MGYHTDFRGELSFNEDITVKQVKAVQSILDHTVVNNRLIDLIITEDMSGLEWDESESTYNLVSGVNHIIRTMSLEFPDFSLSGELKAKGEGQGDVWTLKIVNGEAVKVEEPKVGDLVECPHCYVQFNLKGE